MYPTILNGDEITVEPIKPEVIEIGDIILYRDHQILIAHRVIKILKRSEENSLSAPQGPQDRSSSETLQFILRGDARPACDDPVSAEQILGKVIFVERNGRRINPYALKATLTFYVRRMACRVKRFLN